MVLSPVARLAYSFTSSHEEEIVTVAKDNKHVGSRCKHKINKYEALL